MWRACLATVIVTCMALVAGCGGGGSGQETTPTMDTFGIKINEAPGDGLTAPKPNPFLAGTASSAEVDTARFGDLLALNSVPLQQIAAQRHINWFRLSPFTISARMMVTLQPYNGADPDLYVMSARPNQHDDPDGIIGISNRSNDTIPDGVVGANGWRPDWVTWFDLGGTDGFPAAQVAIFGFGGGTAQIRTEADRCFERVVNGPTWTGTIQQTDSHWLFFNGANGTHYTVNCLDQGGDPDLYVYGDTSTDFKGLNTTTAARTSVGFTANATELHFIRIYGFSATPNQYTVHITSP